MKNSDFGENLITRGSIYEPFLICVTPSKDPYEVIFFRKHVGPTNRRKIVETYFSEKGPKSIYLDSGHLDKPFGPLIS